MPDLNDVRILLVQARSARDIVIQEQECFQERCRIRLEQIRTVNVLSDRLDEEALGRADALMIGGAGEFSAVDDYPWMAEMLELVRMAYRRRLPTFGSCWGHQIIARALGGRVVNDSELAEMGCHSVLLTPAGMEDPLLGAFPQRFLANMGHHDRVVELPAEGIELAYSETQRYQAFRIAGRPMYGTQFHSELDAERERERLHRYREHYPEIAADATFQSVLDNLAETSEVDHLLHDFLLKYVIEDRNG
ncbi:MAG: type 1 glutamine amidotransferase [Rhodothermales bacterium]